MTIADDRVEICLALDIDEAEALLRATTSETAEDALYALVRQAIDAYWRAR